MLGTKIENDHKYLYEALMIDDPLKVGLCLMRVSKGFCVCQISLGLMEFCSLELLVLCFSTAKGSENHWVYLNLAVLPQTSVLWTLVKNFVDT